MDKSRFRSTFPFLTMKPDSFRKINQDILRVLVREKNINAQPVKVKRQLPTLERINQDVPYLTEEKLEEALNSKEISHKTEKLLAWLTLHENLETAKSYYQENPEKFTDIRCLLEMKKLDFSTFVKILIQKHNM